MGPRRASIQIHIYTKQTCVRQTCAIVGYKKHKPPVHKGLELKWVKDAPDSESTRLRVSESPSLLRVCLCTFLISFTNESHHWPAAILPHFRSAFECCVCVDFWQGTRNHKGIKCATSERVLGQIEWAFKCIEIERPKDREPTRIQCD